MTGNAGVAAPSFTSEKPLTTIGDDRFPRYRSHSGESMALVPYSSNESGTYYFPTKKFIRNFLMIYF